MIAYFNVFQFLVASNYNNNIAVSSTMNNHVSVKMFTVIIILCHLIVEVLHLLLLIANNRSKYAEIYIYNIIH